ncbi:MAG: hypothetical protein KIT73_11015 [Burkholderiales bacterium]|nr:hypothetical protein [Burkholderiales bacterium]
MDPSREVDLKDNYLHVLHRDLALALGNAVWAFARIEWRTYEYLRHLSNDNVTELVVDIPFRARCSILRRLVERKTSEAEVKGRALNAIKEIEELANHRNVFVHNPWRIWIDIDAETVMTEIHKHSNSGKKLDLDEIVRFTELAEAAETELRSALGALRTLD